MLDHSSHLVTINRKFNLKICFSGHLFCIAPQRKEIGDSVQDLRNDKSKTSITEKRMRNSGKGLMKESQNFGHNLNENPCYGTLHSMKHPVVKYQFD